MGHFVKTSKISKNSKNYKNPNFRTDFGTEINQIFKLKFVFTRQYPNGEFCRTAYANPVHLWVYP